VKKLMIVLLMISLLFSFSLTTYAETEDLNKKPLITGEINLSEKEEQEYLDSMSKDDFLKIQEKEQEEKLLNSQITTKAVTKISIPGTFTMYQQINNYYCAPASVKSVLQYINGSSASQSTIANGLGTTSDGTSPTKIAPYLNQKQSFYYARFANPSQTDMCDKLYATITGPKKPCLMSIVNISGSNWHYSTGGHRLVINAIYSDKSKIQFADPLGGKQSGWPYYYLKTKSVASSVCRDIIW